MSSSRPEYDLSIANRIEAMDHALTVKELAPLINFSPTKLYDMAREGRIPSYRIDGVVRFDPHAVAEWLRSRAVAAA